MERKTARFAASRHALNRLGALAIALATFAVAGCDSEKSAPTSVPARAKRSVEQLPAAKQRAAQALVRLEAAARARDANELCQSVYLFAGGPPPGCEDSMKRLFPSHDGYSLKVRSLRFSGPARAIAGADVIVIETNGHKTAAPSSTFRLARRSGVWHVVFIS